MWRKVMLNCREFKCVANKDGNCTQEKVAFTPFEDGTVGHMICNESKACEPAPDPQPNPDK